MKIDKALRAAHQMGASFLGDILRALAEENPEPKAEKEFQYRWIPCSERLPPSAFKVLLKYGENARSGSYDYARQQWIVGEAAVGYEQGAFSHWMPMPETRTI